MTLLLTLYLIVLPLQLADHVSLCLEKCFSILQSTKRLHITFKRGQFFLYI